MFVEMEIMLRLVVFITSGFYFILIELSGFNIERKWIDMHILKRDQNSLYQLNKSILWKSCIKVGFSNRFFCNQFCRNYQVWITNKSLRDWQIKNFSKSIQLFKKIEKIYRGWFVCNSSFFVDHGLGRISCANNARFVISDLKLVENDLKKSKIQ